jgi:hypothetical protein
MNLQQALKRIEELERRVRELETRPTEHHHHHYPQPLWPYYQQPTIPQPTWTVPQVWCGAVGAQLNGTL